MRDPERIDRLLDQIRMIWQTHPDYRLGQLIVNFVRPQQPCAEIYNIEDDELEDKINQYHRTFVTPNSLRYFKRYWNEKRGDEHDQWGNSWWYFEVDPANWVVRQIEKYDRGPVLGYDSNHDIDQHGGLSTGQLERLSEFTLTTFDEFNEVWSKRSNSMDAG